MGVELDEPCQAVTPLFWCEENHTALRISSCTGDIVCFDLSIYLSRGLPLLVWTDLVSLQVDYVGLHSSDTLPLYIVIFPKRPSNPTDFIKPD